MTCEQRTVRRLDGTITGSGFVCSRGGTGSCPGVGQEATRRGDGEERPTYYVCRCGRLADTYESEDGRRIVVRHR